MTSEEKEIYPEEPPLFKKWKSWYILVLGNLLALILLLYFLSISFS
ncbi:hypothetical protein [Fulvivirga sedimenti]|uniref:Uncharacterized protein n=1 Tax=Fulvivirga sedimenti TaxID=2879465 RepID=A0A9X1HQ54_9BACT|nr:hypothetical protein [Fulvivirga sedimenti]MCA6074584.1 hypothetical protein [Fulvivirga sedimenti]MCA6075761.1 hypothetical protein [Fulvivirga sedimenti]MCA6076889.1 hypothetical protein [Fulvivirga sedimenti]